MSLIHVAVWCQVWETSLLLVAILLERSFRPDDCRYSDGCSPPVEGKDESMGVGCQSLELYAMSLCFSAAALVLVTNWTPHVEGEDESMGVGCQSLELYAMSLCFSAAALVLVTNRPPHSGQYWPVSLWLPSTHCSVYCLCDPAALVPKHSRNSFDLCCVRLATHPQRSDLVSTVKSLGCME